MNQYKMLEIIYTLDDIIIKDSEQRYYNYSDECNILLYLEEELHRAYPNIQFNYGGGVDKLVVIVDNEFAIKFAHCGSSSNVALEYEAESPVVDMFPEIYAKVTPQYTGSISGITYYTQDFVYTQNYNDVAKKFISSPKSRKTIECEYTYTFDSNWMASIVDKLGYEYFKNFSDYVKEHRSEFCDMHDGNYGYFHDGTPAILDYYV